MEKELDQAISVHNALNEELNTIKRLIDENGLSMYNTASLLRAEIDRVAHKINELSNAINTVDIELELLESTYDFSLYNYIVNGEYKGQFEVQFDDDKFNGVIMYSGFDTENEVGEFEWVEVNKLNSLYKVIRDKAIKDYKRC